MAEWTRRYCPAIVRAITDTGFTGYLPHEFIPTRDPMTSLREAVVLCNVQELAPRNAAK